MSPIPALILEALRRYEVQHVRPGRFLLAVLQDRLADAVRFGDAESLACLPDIVRWCIWELPGACWGSPAAVSAWLSAGPVPVASTPAAPQVAA